MAADTAGPTDEFGIPIIPGPADAAQRRRQAIIDAALAEFLKEGYAAASMDAITARSGVSKATVYKHFGNKERLFLAVVGGVLPRAYEDLGPGTSALAESTDLRSALIALTHDWTRLVLRPDIMSLRRLVIGEIDRFPQLGRLWYRVSYEMINGPLVEALTELDRLGLLAVPDPELAVRQLVACTVGVLQLVHTFSPGTEPDEAEVLRTIGSGVDLFLAGYAKR